jgi:hypothetical protein
MIHASDHTLGAQRSYDVCVLYFILRLDTLSNCTSTILVTGKTPNTASILEKHSRLDRAHRSRSTFYHVLRSTTYSTRLINLACLQ